MEEAKKEACQENASQIATEQLNNLMTENQKLKEASEQLLLERKTELVEEIMSFNKSAVKEELMTKELAELKIVREYEKKLSEAQKKLEEKKEVVKEEVKFKAVAEQNQTPLNVVEGFENAKAGDIVIERVGRGLEISKMPDYSKQGWGK